ncbi:hypothetical protein PG985_000808 [Apiospora marii]|uniref:Uncharacterized protein n=1 Tax=Apiospora marii TaxID=335849 RepID=A0ABR1R419_9PEZI
MVKDAASQQGSVAGRQVSRCHLNGPSRFRWANGQNARTAIFLAALHCAALHCVTNLDFPIAMN